MYEVHFFKEDPIIVEAHHFDTVAGNIIFCNELGARIAYISNQVVKYVIGKNE